MQVLPRKKAGRIRGPNLGDRLEVINKNNDDGEGGKNTIELCSYSGISCGIRNSNKSNINNCLKKKWKLTHNHKVRVPE